MLSIERPKLPNISTDSPSAASAASAAEENIFTDSISAAEEAAASFSRERGQSPPNRRYDAVRSNSTDAETASPGALSERHVWVPAERLPTSNSPASLDDPDEMLNSAEMANLGAQAAELDLEAQAPRSSYVDGLQTSSASKAHAIVAEFTAKFIASALHFGVARQYAEEAARNGFAKYAENPEELAVIAALLTAPVLAAAHYAGEVYIRPVALRILGSEVAATEAAKAFPEDVAAQRTMGAQQAAGKIGKVPADLIGLAAFSLAHAIRAALGFTSPIAFSIASGLGGGTMAALHALMNLSTHTRSDVHDLVAPTHHVKTGQPIRDGLASAHARVVGSGSLTDQIANGLHDVIGVRGLASLQGLLIANLIKAQLTRKGAGADLTAGERFSQAMVGSIALLGLGFFANLGLAARRGRTSGPMSGTIGAIRSLDPRTSAENGGLMALMGTSNDGAIGRTWNKTLTVADGAGHIGKTSLTLPAHAVLDLANLPTRAAKQALFGDRQVDQATSSEPPPQTADDV
jgi:hypothetical protein